MEKATVAEPEVKERETSTGIDTPPIYGRCPVCGKELRPVCKLTGKPQAPITDNTDYRSRARCTKCGTVLQYMGSGNWKVYTDG